MAGKKKAKKKAVRKNRGGAVKLIGNVLGFGFAVLCAAAEVSAARERRPIVRVTTERKRIRGGLFYPDKLVVVETTRVYDDECDLRWNDPSKITTRTLEIEEYEAW